MSAVEIFQQRRHRLLGAPVDAVDHLLFGTLHLIARSKLAPAVQCGKQIPAKNFLQFSNSGGNQCASFRPCSACGDSGCQGA